MALWAALFILVVAVVAMAKRIETRLVLVVAGIAMASVAGNPMAAFDGFTKGMIEKDMVTVICSVMGFAFVMKYTQCDTHLTVACTGSLRHVRGILIPGAVLVTCFINVSLASAAGVCAAVGMVVIPLLVCQGISPHMAASAVMMGTFGSIFSPGHAHNALVAKVSSGVYGKTVTVMDVIFVHWPATLLTCLTGAICLWIIAIIRKEHKGYVDVNNEFTPPEGFKVNPLFAFIPVIPVLLLIMGAAWPQTFPALKKMRVEHVMIIGSAIGLLATWKDPKKGTKEFFNGLGRAYADIIGIIIGVGCFVGGMQAAGIITAALDLMKGSSSIAGIAAATGPFALAVLSGSGNAAAIAFNEALTPHALEVGFDPIILGWIATVSAVTGRAMSPCAGATVVCAGLAKVDPIEITKRNVIPTVLCTAVAYIVLVYFTPLSPLAG